MSSTPQESEFAVHRGRSATVLEAEREVERILNNTGGGDSSGQAVVPVLAPADRQNTMRSNGAGSSSAAAGSAGAATSAAGPKKQQDTATAADGQTLAAAPSIEEILNSMDFSNQIPKYTIGESESVTMDEDFVQEFFLCSDQGWIERLFALIVDPEIYRQKWEKYCSELQVQLREEERERLEDLERERIFQQTGQRPLKKLNYVRKARKPWEPENIDDESKLKTKKGFNVNVRDPAEFYSTALHKAVHKIRMDVITLLTRCEGCDVNLYNDFGETPLHFAVKNGHVQSTFMLLKRGSRIDVRDKAYDTPMSLGIKLARDGCCKLLIEFGADVSELYDRTLVKIRKMNLTEDEDGAKAAAEAYYDEMGFLSSGSKNAHESVNAAEVEKWRAMAKQSVRTGKFDYKTLKKKIRKGIPFAIRGLVWKSFIPIEQLKDFNPGVYEKHASMPSTSSKQIDLDINRTFREHRLFKERYGEYQIRLFNVLKAYSTYNPQVAYCQGMSSLTAFYLMFLEKEEDAFWMLVETLRNEKYDLYANFLPGFPGLYECFYVHERLLEKNLPKLHAHLKHEQIETSMYATKWYMLLMMDILPFSSVARLWDIFLFEGRKVMYNVIVSIFRALEPQMLKMDFERIMTFISGLSNVNIDLDALIDGATKHKIKNKVIQKFVSDYRAQKKKEELQRQQAAAQYQKAAAKQAYKK